MVNFPLPGWVNPAGQFFYGEQFTSSLDKIHMRRISFSYEGKSRACGTQQVANLINQFLTKNGKETSQTTRESKGH